MHHTVDLDMILPMRMPKNAIKQNGSPASSLPIGRWQAYRNWVKAPSGAFVIHNALKNIALSPSANKPSRVGWNKRSGSTKQDKGHIQGSIAIDVHLDSPFAGELLLNKRFFLRLQAIGVLLQSVDFLSAVVSYRGDLLFRNRLLVEPLRLFHPTGLLCAE